MLPLGTVLMLFGMVHAQNFDFQHSLGADKTLYFKILSPTTVGLTYPNLVSNNYYSGYTKPRGHIVIPSTVTHGGTTYTVTAITFNTFYQCDSILSVTIPATVTAVGDYAFYGCTLMESLDLGNGVTSIGQNAFYGNHHLTTLTLPRQIASVGTYAFSNCSQLRTVNFNADSCTAMPGSFSTNNASLYSVSNTVWGNSPINKANFGPNVKYIPANLFVGRTAIDTVMIPNSVRSIGNYAFGGCNIKHIIWGNSLDSIGHGAFFSNSLPALSFPSSLKYIGASSFTGNSLITELTIPAHIEEICVWSFSFWNALTTVNFNADSCINPSTATNLSWFGSCPNLTTINIGNNVKNIPYAAFRDTRIVNLIIPNSVTNIERRAFAACQNLLGVIMGNGVRSIGREAFSSCTSLSSVQMGSSVERIEYQAFAYCAALASLNIPSAQYLGNSVFDGCTNLQQVLLPEGLDSIGENAFGNCQSLSSISLPNTLQYLGERAFTSCSSLTSLTIPPSVTYIGNCAIQNCTSLTDVYFNADSCLTMSAVPGWKRESAFQNSNPSLQIHLGNNVKHLPDYAFYGCNNVSEIIIPASVTRIGSGAFSDMGNLSLIRSYATVPPTASYLVSSSKYSIPLYVPCTAILDYQQAPGWSSFTNYQMISGDYSMHVSSDNSGQGTVEYMASPCETGQATVQAVPASRYRFVSWNDGSIVNPRTLTLSQDTVLTAAFEPDTFIVSTQALSPDRGTVIGAGVYYRGDTATLYAFPTGGFVFDSWNTGSTDNPLSLTVASDTLLSATFSFPPRDTLVVDNFVHDTTCIYVPVHDTTYIDVPVHDTTYIDVFVHDTTYVDVPVHDTTYIDIFVHDTIYIDVPVHDTTYITHTDTLTVVQTDTVTLTDTLTVYQIDTLTVYSTDTLWLTDTIYIDRIVHDTVYIHDTVYVSIDDVETVDYMIYQQGGQIVVEGADGQPVAVYDAVGRLLATRRDTFGAVRFEAPVSGAYLVRVGNAAARRIVVVR